MSITKFTDNGRNGTKENLFTNAMSTMPGSDFDNLYGALTPVLAKQFVNIPDTPVNPVTKAFIGEALTFGDVIEDIFIDPVAMGATKTATSGAGAIGSATDEFAFADVGIRKQYATINAMNTGKVSKYRHELNKVSLNGGVAGSIGDGIIEALRVGQVACLENQAAKVLVSSIDEDNNVYCGVEDTDTPAQAILKERQKIIDVCMDMSKVNSTYAGTDYESAAKNILVFAPKNKWAELILDKSGVFHPEFLMFDEFKQLGVTITPIAVDDLATPVTTAEAQAYTTYSGITWEDAPGKDEDKPDYVVCDARFMRINPFIDRYEMYTTPVNANVPYENFFLHMQNAISYQPNRKAVRVYVGEEPEVVRYTATFVDADTQGGETIGTVTVEAGQPVVFTTTPSHEGVTFAGWDPTFISGTTVITEDTTFTATYEVIQYTATFVDAEAQGGETIGTVTVDYGEPVVFTTIPEHQDLTFAGWDPEFVSGTTVITQNTTFTATYDV